MQIPGYEIQQMIGEGRAATVFLAMQSSLHRPVALKVIKPALAADGQFTERFLMKGKAIAQLSHPNIVTVYEIREFEENYYLSMEFFSRGNLKQKIERGLARARVLEIIRTIAEALAYAHSQGVLHLDIKPENILFRDDGTAVLTDFGVDRPQNSDLGRTVEILNRGLPYPSPEQSLGGVVDARSDIYSLGGLFYEMLVGRPPYEGGDEYDRALMNATNPVPRLAPGFEVFQPVLDRMLAKQPADRFQTVQDFIEILNRAENDPEWIEQYGGRGAGSEDQTLIKPPRILTLHPSSIGKWRGIRWIGGFKGGAMLLGLGLLLALIATALILIFEEPPPEPTAPVVKVEPKVEPPPSTTPVEESPPSQEAEQPSSAPAPSPDEELVAMDADQPPPDSAQDPKIMRLLEQAGRQLKASRLTAPPGDNAYESYQQVLERDPGNAQAQAGIERIVTKLLALGERQLQEGNLAMPIGDNAYESFSWALELAPDNAQAQSGIDRIKAQLLAQGEQELEAAPSVSPQHKTALEAFNWVLGIDPDNAGAQAGVGQIKAQLLERGKEQLQDSRLTTPEGDNAFETYQQVLEIDPDNAEAQEGFMQIVAKYLLLAQIRNNDEQYRTSLNMIDRGLWVTRQRRSSQDPVPLNDLRRRLEALRQQVVDKMREPKLPPLATQAKGLLENARADPNWCSKRKKIEDALYKVAQAVREDPANSELLAIRNEGWSMHAQALRACPPQP